MAILRIRVPPAEAVELLLPGGEKVYLRSDAYTGDLTVRVEAPRDRRIGYMWMPANVVQRIAEALLVRVARER